MKNTKRILAIVLTIAFVMSIATIAFADGDDVPRPSPVRDENEIMLVSNLQNSLYADNIPAPKNQLSWIARGAGNNRDNYAHNASWDTSDVNEFSYEFQNEDGTIQGRIQGNDGVITVQALGLAGRYVTVTSASTATANVPNAEEVYEFAMNFAQHFATITAWGHDHGNHTGFAPATNATSTERFPIVPLIPVVVGGTAPAANTPGHVTYENNADESIVFVYSRHDLGGMMSGIILPAAMQTAELCVYCGVVHVADRDWGDITGDGNIDINDVLHLLMYMVNIRSSAIFVDGAPAMCAAWIATAPGQGQPNINDVLHILMYMVNIQSSNLILYANNRPHFVPAD